MPKATCQLNLTLEVPVSDHVERIAREANLRPSGAGRILFEQRLALEAAGWQIANKDLLNLFEAICRLDEAGLDLVKSYVWEVISTK